MTHPIRCHCGAVWSLDDLLAQEDMNSIVDETIAERICFLCRAEPNEPTILGFFLSDFKLMRIGPWKDIFKGLLDLQSCRMCRAISIGPWKPSKKEIEFVETAKTMSEEFKKASNRATEIAVNQLLAEPEDL